jgi:hypothetical protein
MPSSYRTVPRSSSSVKTMCEQKIAARRLRLFRCRDAMTIPSYQSNLSCSLSLPHTTADYTHCRACWRQRVGLFPGCRFFLLRVHNSSVREKCFSDLHFYINTPALLNRDLHHASLQFMFFPEHTFETSICRMSDEDHGMSDVMNNTVVV